jgi:hypothetical protein
MIGPLVQWSRECDGTSGIWSMHDTLSIGRTWDSSHLLTSAVDTSSMDTPTSTSEIPHVVLMVMGILYAS